MGPGASRGRASPLSVLGLILAVLYLVMMKEVQGAVCSTGNENCSPWDSVALIRGPPPAGVTQVCNVHINSVDIDYDTIVVTGGRTADANRVLGQTTLKCYNGNYRGFVNKWTNGVLNWEKYIHGHYGSSTGNGVDGVLWVGLSRSALAHNQAVYSTYMAAYIRMGRQDYVVFIQMSDGSFLTIQNIQTSNPYTFGGYASTEQKVPYNDVFKFQVLTHGGALSNYRIFHGFEDTSTVTNRRWTLHARSQTQLQSTIDTSGTPGSYRYGCTAVDFMGGMLYFGGGREYTTGGGVNGMVPLMGQANPTTLTVTQAHSFQAQNNANGPRFIIDKIYLTRDTSNYYVFGLGRRRENGNNALIDENNEYLLVIGRDHLAPTTWKNNWGCFDYSTFVVSHLNNKYMYLDDVIGPIGGNLRVLIRSWNKVVDRDSHILQRIDGYNYMYEAVINNFDQVSCIGGGTKDQNAPGLDIDYRRWDNRQCNVPNITNFEIGRMVYTSRSINNFVVLCSGTQVQAGNSGGMVTINSGAQAAIVYRLKDAPDNTFNTGPGMHKLQDQENWLNVGAEFGAAAIISTPQYVPLTLPLPTLPATTIPASGGTPARVIDVEYLYTKVSTIERFTYSAFGAWDDVAQNHYHFQQYDKVNQQTWYSNNDVVTTGQNYTGAFANILDIIHLSSNTQIQLTIERMTTNCPKKDFWFYIGGNNIWASNLSPLYHVKLSCPPTPIPQYFHQNLQASGRTSVIVFVSPGWTNTYWNPFSVNEDIVCCGFQNYQLTFAASDTGSINYSYYTAAACDQNVNNCRYVTHDRSTQRKFVFNVKAWRVEPWSDVASSQDFIIYVTNCMNLDVTYIITQVPMQVYELSLIPNVVDTVTFASAYQPYITQSPPGQNCNIERYELMNYTFPSMPITDTKFRTFNLNNPPTAFHYVQRDIPMMVQFKIKAWSFVDTFGIGGDVLVVVCGNETVKTKVTDKVIWMFVQDTNVATQIVKYNQQTLVDYFEYRHPLTDQCYVKYFKLYKEFNRTAYTTEDWNQITNPEIQLTGSWGTWEWRISKAAPIRHNLWLSGISRGNVMDFKEFEINVCSANSMQATSSYKTIIVYQPQYATNSGVKGQFVIKYDQEIKPMFNVVNCPYCKEKIKFKLIDSATGLDYTGTQVSLAENNDIVINTNTPVHDFNITYRVTMKHDGLCYFMADFDLKLDIEICGYERVLVQDQSTPIALSKVFNLERNSIIYNVTDLFSVSVPNECPIVQIELRSSPVVSKADTGRTVWDNFIILKKGDLYINHNQVFYEQIANNTVFRVYVTATTFGNIIGWKEVRFTLVYPPRVEAPKFTKPPERWVVKIYGEDQWAGYETPVIRYDLPRIDEKDSTLFDIKVYLDGTNCECVKIFANPPNPQKPNALPAVWVELDRSWVTYRDEGVLNATVEFIDKDRHNSFLKSYDSFQIEIDYVPSDPIYDPNEFYKKKVKITSNKTLTAAEINRNWFNWFSLSVMQKGPTFIAEYPGTTLIKPTVNTDRKILLSDREYVLEAFEDYRKALERRQFPNISDPLPVRLQIYHISQDGKVFIRFNQRLFVPPLGPYDFNKADRQYNLTKDYKQWAYNNFGFFKQALRPNFFDMPSSNSTSNGRRMEALYQLDVNRDVFDVRYRLRNNIDPEGIQYDLHIKEWTETGMVLQLDFEYPRNVSIYDKFDHLIIKIKNTDLFVSKESGIKVSENHMLLQEGIPKQFGTSVDSQSLDLEANLFIGVVRVIVASLITYSVWFGYSLSDMWQLLYALQIICQLTRSDVYFPITAGVFLKHLTSFINFDLINPFFWVWVADEQFRVDKWVLNEPWSFTQMHKDQYRSYLNEFSVFIFWALLIFCIFWLFKVVKRKTKNERIRLVIRHFNHLIDDKLYFNGYIRIYSIIYLQLCFCCFEQLDMWARHSRYQNWPEQVTTVIIFIFILASLAYSIHILRKYRTILGTEINRKVFENLYEGIHLYRDNRNVWYFPIFLLRRLIYASIPFTFHHIVGMQLQFFMALSLFYFTWYANNRPHQESRLMRIEIFNQFMILVTFYVCLYFTEYNPFEYSFNTVGVIFVIIICIIIVVNLGHIMIKAWRQWLKYQELHRRQLLWSQYLLRYQQQKLKNSKMEMHNNRVLKENPDALKPKIKKQTKNPSYYKQKISYHLNQQKFEKLKIITGKHFYTDKDSVQKLISKTIFEELGDFEQIVELSRQDILKDYCQPLKKETDKNDRLYKIKELGPLPSRIKTFMITFDQSSKNRWASFYARPWGVRHEVTWDEIKNDANRVKQAAKQATFGVGACMSRSVSRLGLFRKRHPQNRATTLKTIETTEMDEEQIKNMAYNENLGNLDTMKAIDHFQKVKQASKAGKGPGLNLGKNKHKVADTVPQQSGEQLHDLFNDKSNRTHRVEKVQTESEMLGQLESEVSLDDLPDSDDQDMRLEDYQTHSIHNFNHKTLVSNPEGKPVEKPAGKPQQPAIPEDPEEDSEFDSEMTDLKGMADDFSSFQNTPTTNIRSGGEKTSDRKPLDKRQPSKSNIFKLPSELKPIKEEEDWKEDGKSPDIPKKPVVKKDVKIALGPGEK